MRDRDRGDAAQRRTISNVASSMKLMQSHSTLPAPVRNSSARCPIAKAGVVPIPISPGSCRRNALKCLGRIDCNVVQAWPSRFTYCRSSWHIRQPDGGVSLSGYCVPQVVQMNAGMRGLPFQPIADASRIGRCRITSAPITARFSRLNATPTAKAGA